MCQDVFDAGYDRGYAAGLEDGLGEGLRLKVAVGRALHLLEGYLRMNSRVREAAAILLEASAGCVKGPPSVGEDEVGG